VGLGLLLAAGPALAQARGYVGLRIQDMTAGLASVLGLDSPRGALIAWTIAGGPAEKGGLQPGDVVLTMDGQAISNQAKLIELMAGSVVGTPIKFGLWRQRAGLEIEILPTAAPAAQPTVQRRRGPPPEAPPIGSARGIGLIELSAAMRRHYAIADEYMGALVGEVEALSLAARLEMQPGDVLVAVGGVKVENARHALELLRQAEAVNVLALAVRDNAPRFIILPAGT